MTYIINIPGTPVSQQRARITKSGNFDPCKKDKTNVRWVIVSELTQEQLQEIKSWKNYDVKIRIQVKFPANITKKAIQRYVQHSECPPQKKDLDNYAKFYLDAGNGLLWNDDRFIQNLTIYRTFSLKSEGVTIWVSKFDIRNLKEIVNLDYLFFKKGASEK